MADTESRHKRDSSSDSSSTKLDETHAQDFAQTGFQPITVSHTRTTSRPTGEDLVNLPSRTLSNDARLEEYTEETGEGTILKTVKSHQTGKYERYELVTWKINDPENPKNWSKAYKWWCTMCVAFTCFVVALNSSVITADIEGPAEEFGVSHEVSLLAITLFVVGFGVGKHRHYPIIAADALTSIVKVPWHSRPLARLSAGGPSTARRCWWPSSSYCPVLCQRTLPLCWLAALSMASPSAHP